MRRAGSRWTSRSPCARCRSKPGGDAAVPNVSFEPFTLRAKRAIAAVPFGQVATYGQIAACAGNHRAARQIAWLLHSASETERLPWHRVIGGRGSISLPRGGGFEEQRALLEAEGVAVDEAGRIDLSRYLCTLRLDPPPTGTAP
ncbi:MAG: MGMT family protein [Spirochaetales bacterium]|nr:MGMT family protein [Spirochaetales bacterium]